MIKKTRLSFSSLAKDDKIASGTSRREGGKLSQETVHRGERKVIKNSTYQYSKKKYGARGGSPFKNQSNSSNSSKIPPAGNGVIRIIPLGGAEEIGKNMTAIEIGEDIAPPDFQERPHQLDSAQIAGHGHPA